MKTWLLFLPACCVAVAVGCGGDDDSSSPGRSSGGKAGSSAGHAGKTSGPGGGAGEGGMATGGSGGSSARGGSSATSGAGGASGAPEGGGAPGGNSAGGEGGTGELGTLDVEPASVSVASGEERTVCAVLDLGNTRPFHAGELHVTTSDPVFELRVSAVSGTASPTPSDCEPFGDLSDASARPLLFTRERDEDVVFPAGTAYTLEAHQLLRFEIHTLNDGASAVDARAHLTLVPAASYEREAGLLLLYNHDFTVAAGAQRLATAYFDLPSGFGGASIFRTVGDTHRFGTEVSLSVAPISTGPFTSFYDATWSSPPPPPADVAPPVVIPDSGGLELDCRFDNTSATSVADGPSSTAERCLGYVYYAPATSTAVCVDFNGSVLCCPGGGSSCSSL